MYWENVPVQIETGWVQMRELLVMMEMGVGVVWTGRGSWFAIICMS